VSDAFYEPLGGGRFRATEHTVGPWEPDAQHGGPPSALLGREIERCEPRPGWLVARTTVEILGPVPVAELEVHARLTRPGRSVELLTAELSAGGRVVARAHAWRIRQDGALAVEASLSPPPSRPDDVRTLDVLAEEWSAGYLRAMEWRYVSGEFDRPGPATLWARPRLPLVADEEVSPLQRVLLLADSGNGVSGELDLRQWYFINPELTVHLYREPVGEWLCLDARTSLGPRGVGLAESRLYDERGAVGRGAQALLIARRPTPPS
jgi:Thioesterase-like superfamily